MRGFLLALLLLLSVGTASAQPSSVPLTATDGTTTVRGTNKITFSGATVVNGGGGNAQFSLTGLTNLNATTQSTFAGTGAGASFSGGASSAGFGYNALNLLVSDTYNAAFGFKAGGAFTGHAIAAFGAGSGSTVSTGSDNNAFGADAMANDDFVATYTTGVGNSAFGTHTLGHLSSGSFNVAIGNESMVGCGNWTGFPACLLTGGSNTGVGNYTLQNIIGAAAENTAIGYSAGTAITTGAQNIFLGSSAGSNLTTGTLNIMIGRDVRGSGATVSNELNIGNLIRGTNLAQGGASPSGGTVSISGNLTATGIYPAALTNAYLGGGGANEMDVFNNSAGLIAKFITSSAGSGTSMAPYLAAGGGSIATFAAASTVGTAGTTQIGLVGGAVSLGGAADTTTANGAFVATSDVYPTGALNARISAGGVAELDIKNNAGGSLAKIIGSNTTGAASSYVTLQSGGGTVAQVYGGGNSASLQIGQTSQPAFAPGGIEAAASALLTLANGDIGLQTTAAADSAPGAGGGRLRLKCGTNAGTAKLVIYAGTSSTPFTILDNIGAGVTGC